MNNQSILRGCHKELRPLLRQIIDLGGELRLTGGNHVVVRLGGRMIYVALTPKIVRNYLHELRKLIREHSNGAVEPVSARHRKGNKKGKGGQIQMSDDGLGKA